MCIFVVFAAANSVLYGCPFSLLQRFICLPFFFFSFFVKSSFFVSLCLLFRTLLIIKFRNSVGSAISIHWISMRSVIIFTSYSCLLFTHTIDIAEVLKAKTGKKKLHIYEPDFVDLIGLRSFVYGQTCQLQRNCVPR